MYPHGDPRYYWPYPPITGQGTTLKDVQETIEFMEGLKQKMEEKNKKEAEEKKKKEPPKKPELTASQVFVLTLFAGPVIGMSYAYAMVYMFKMVLETAQMMVK